MTNHALLVVDMQKAYFRNKALAKAEKQLVRSTNELLQSADKNDIPIFFVVTEHATDTSTWTLNMLEDDEGYLFAGEDDTSMVDGIMLHNAEIVTKTRDSAFFQTDLVAKLQEKDIDTLVILGVSTHGCILQTSADAYAYNYRVILAVDAIRSHDPKYHKSTLELLEQEYRQLLCSNQEIVSILDKRQRTSQPGFRKVT